MIWCYPNAPRHHGVLLSIPLIGGSLEGLCILLAKESWSLVLKELRTRDDLLDVLAESLSGRKATEDGHFRSHLELVNVYKKSHRLRLERIVQDDRGDAIADVTSGGSLVGSVPLFHFCLGS